MNIGILSLPTKRRFEDALLSEIKSRRPLDDICIYAAGDLETTMMELEVILALGAVSSEEIQRHPNLKLIHAIGAGHETIDERAATKDGVWLSYSPSAETGNAISVAEFVLMQMLILSRDLPSIVASTVGSSMANSGTTILFEKKVVVVGWGAIGQAVAERLLPFGCDLSVITRTPSKATTDLPIQALEHLKRGVHNQDFVILCLRADETNLNLFNRDVFAFMKKGSMFINVARGSLVDEDALYASLKSKHLRAAALDVLRSEPASTRNPLLRLPQALVTPHMAGMTEEMLHGTAKFIDQVMTAFASGKRFPSILNEPLKPRHALVGNP